MGALVHVTAWERVSFWRRVPIAFLRVALLIVLLAILFHFLAPPIGFSLTARWMAHKAPEVNVSPKRLADYSVSGPAAALSESGYQFKVPWNVARRVQKVNGGPLVLIFQTGQVLILFTPANQGLLTEIAQDKSMHADDLPLVMGDLMNRSPYDQYAALLNTTPSSIRAFGPRQKAVRGLMLLTFKAIAVGPGLETGVFSIDLPDKRAFQVGDPGKSPRVELEIFGRDDYHVEFVCSAAKNGPRLTQPELNLILTSVHPLPATPAER